MSFGKWADALTSGKWGDKNLKPTSLKNIENASMQFIRFNCLDTENSSGVGLSGYGVREQSLQKPKSDYIFDYTVSYPFGK